MRVRSCALCCCIESSTFFDALYSKIRALWGSLKVVAIATLCDGGQSWSELVNLTLCPILRKAICSLQLELVCFSFTVCSCCELVKYMNNNSRVGVDAFNGFASSCMFGLWSNVKAKCERMTCKACREEPLLLG